MQAEEREGLPLQMGVDPLPPLQYSRQGVGGGHEGTLAGGLCYNVSC